MTERPFFRPPGSRKFGKTLKTEEDVAAEADRIFAEYGGLAKDPEALRKQLEEDLVAKHGQEWLDANRAYLDATWEQALQLLG